MTVDLVPHTLQFMKGLFTRWKVPNLLALVIGKDQILSILIKIEQL